MKIPLVNIDTTYNPVDIIDILTQRLTNLLSSIHIIFRQYRIKLFGTAYTNTLIGFVPSSSNCFQSLTTFFILCI